MTTQMTLNTVNNVIIEELAIIQVECDATQSCATRQMEINHLYARGKARLGLPEMATQITGALIARMDDVVEERKITIFQSSELTNKVTRYTQSLNASVKMVALHSALLSGFTDVKTITTALMGWIEEDRIQLDIDCEAVAVDLVTEMIKAEILNGEQGTAVTDEGAFYSAYGCTATVNELRLKTIRNLWKHAQPRMQPMKHAITWRLTMRGNAVCDIPNLKLLNSKSIATKEFVLAANKASHVGYVINSAIRAELELWLERDEMEEIPDDADGQEVRNILNEYHDRVRVVEELMLLPLHTVMYFPHTADWRGRLYPRGGLTHFQSIKECKAIFDFKDYVQPKNPTGLYMHVANAHGMDKGRSINQRVQWVRDNKQAIINGELAKNIYAQRSALALAEYTATGATNVICHIDGTCNGTQHTATMYRDFKTACLVNAVCSSLDTIPKDMYGVVAERASKIAIGAEKEILIRLARELAKDPIMTLGYGAGKKVIILHMIDYLNARREKASPKKLVEYILTAIDLVAPAVVKLTKNLKRILKAKPRNSVQWTAFDLTVVKSYSEHNRCLHGSKYSAMLAPTKNTGEQTEEERALYVLECNALARGISPNYVHSLDSAHVRAILREVTWAISCIHDSIGCPADKVIETSKVVQMAFYEMHKHDLVKNIYDAIGAPYTDQRGKLDIEELQHALLLFS